MKAELNPPEPAETDWLAHFPSVERLLNQIEAGANYLLEDLAGQECPLAALKTLKDQLPGADSTAPGFILDKLLLERVEQKILHGRF